MIIRRDGRPKVLNANPLDQRPIVISELHDGNSIPTFSLYQNSTMGDQRRCVLSIVVELWVHAYDLIL